MIIYRIFLISKHQKSIKQIKNAKNTKPKKLQVLVFQ